MNYLVFITLDRQSATLSAAVQTQEAAKAHAARYLPTDVVKIRSLERLSRWGKLAVFESECADSSHRWKWDDLPGVAIDESIVVIQPGAVPA